MMYLHWLIHCPSNMAENNTDQLQVSLPSGIIKIEILTEEASMLPCHQSSLELYFAKLFENDLYIANVTLDRRPRNNSNPPSASDPIYKL